MTRTDIKWASRIEASTGGGRPGFALGAPDGQSASVFVGQSATYAGWNRASYQGLAELLGEVVAGDAVTPEMLAGADVIAFEMNGNSPAHSGGWESCDWEFRDSQSAIVVHWDESTIGGVFLGTPVPRDPRVVANGTLSGDRYGRFFGLPPSLVTTDQPLLTPEEVRISFLLFRVRGEIDVTGPAFRLTLTGVPRTPTSPNATPDPDAIGVLLHDGSLPARPVKPVKSPTRQVQDLCRVLATGEAVLPALAAVWERRAVGQPSRNDVEGTIYQAFDRLSADHRDALGHGFDGYHAFRALGTDSCLFDDRLAHTVAERPLEKRELLEELVREGLAFSTQSVMRGSGGEIGPGLARPFKRLLFFEGSPVPQTAAWPWITAVRPRIDGDSEFGNTESFRPPPGQQYQPLAYQFDQTCQVRPGPNGLVQQCKRVQALAAPGSFGGVCAGGSRYTFGRDCLRFPSQAAGGSVVLRGLNFTSPSLKVHLKSLDDPTRPPVILDCIVWGDRATPLTDESGDVIADMRVRDHVDVPLPREDPLHIGAPFPAGLYEIWVTVTDASDPAAPVTRESNRLVLRIEPRPDIRFALRSNRGRCEEETSGPGNDEIWWDAFVGHIVPVNEPLSAGEVAASPVRNLRRVEFPRDAWDEMESGKRTEYACELFSGAFERDGVLCVGIVGLEVDSESAAREQLRGFWDAFAEAMKFLVLAVVSVAGGAATEIAKEAVKKGAVSGVSATTAAGAVAVVGAVVVVSAALWAAWAPADIVALDVFTIDALTAARNTDGKTAIGGATERSWRVEEEWMVVRERPLPKVGNPGELAMTWVQENEYRSGGEDSRYVLEFRLAQRPTA